MRPTLEPAPNPRSAAPGEGSPLLHDAAAVHTLANGVRVVALPMPHLQTAGVSVFVRVGSAHESRALNGIGHVLEHMAFKGTRERDAHRVNLDAEVLGAEVNAHTDKDHTAYHMRGLGEHAPRFVAMLADIVRHATFPARRAGARARGAAAGGGRGRGRPDHRGLPVVRPCLLGRRTRPRSR